MKTYQEALQLYIDLMPPEYYNDDDFEEQPDVVLLASIYCKLSSEVVRDLREIYNKEELSYMNSKLTENINANEAPKESASTEIIKVFHFSSMDAAKQSLNYKIFSQIYNLDVRAVEHEKPEVYVVMIDREGKFQGFLSSDTP